MFNSELISIRSTAIESLMMRESELVNAHNELTDIKENQMLTPRGRAAVSDLLGDIETALREVRDDIVIAEGQAEVDFVVKFRGELGL